MPLGTLLTRPIVKSPGFWPFFHIFEQPVCSRSGSFVDSFMAGWRQSDGESADNRLKDAPALTQSHATAHRVGRVFWSVFVEIDAAVA